MPRKSESEEHPMNEIVKVKLSEIDPESTVNVRRNKVKESVEVVKSSIKKNGYWPEFPIVLRPHPNPQSKFAYENVSGQCRAEACRQLDLEEKLGIEEIPAVIADLDDNDALKRSFDENDKSTPLSPSDYTRIVKKKYKEFEKQDCTSTEAYKKTAAFWNISVAKAKRYYGFGSLSKSLKEKVDQKALPEDAAEAIVKSSELIADEEDKKKKMEEKAEWFGKQERNDRKIAKQAILKSGSDAAPEELDKKMKELSNPGKTHVEFEIEEDSASELKKWGSGEGLATIHHSRTLLSI